MLSCEYIIKLKKKKKAKKQKCCFTFQFHKTETDSLGRALQKKQIQSYNVDSNYRKPLPWKRNATWIMQKVLYYFMLLHILWPNLKNDTEKVCLMYYIYFYKVQWGKLQWIKPNTQVLGYHITLSVFLGNMTLTQRIFRTVLLS